MKNELAILFEGDGIRQASEIRLRAAGDGERFTLHGLYRRIGQRDVQYVHGEERDAVAFGIVLGRAAHIAVNARNFIGKSVVTQIFDGLWNEYAIGVQRGDGFRLDGDDSIGYPEKILTAAKADQRAQQRYRKQTKKSLHLSIFFPSFFLLYTFPVLKTRYFCEILVFGGFLLHLTKACAIILPSTGNDDPAPCGVMP